MPRLHPKGRLAGEKTARPNVAAPEEHVSLHLRSSVEGRTLTWHTIECRPDALLAVPGAAARPLGVLGGALLEEVGVLDPIEYLNQPGQRMRLDLPIAA